MTRKPRRYVLCVHAEGDVDLESRKRCEVLPDERAAADGYLRVIDESGEDYLCVTGVSASYRMHAISPTLMVTRVAMWRPRDGC